MKMYRFVNRAEFVLKLYIIVVLFRTLCFIGLESLTSRCDLKGVDIMLFPVAGIEVAPWLPFLAGFTIAFFCSMGGVAGANLVLPFQMSVLGFVTPAVTPTNHIYNLVAIPVGVYRYIKEGRMVWPLTCVVIAGTVPGVLLGVVLRVKYLDNPVHFKLFAGVVLLSIGYLMVRSLLKRDDPKSEKGSSEKRFHELMAKQRKNNRSGCTNEGSETEKLPQVVVEHFGLRSVDYTFCGEKISAPTMGIFSLSAIVGVVGGIYGIGGGSIIAPFFVAVFHLPVYTIAGACLMGTFLTSFTATIMFQVVSFCQANTTVAPDWLLGGLLGVGGMIGMYSGARLQKYVRAKLIKWILTFVVVFAGGRYVVGYLFF